jgi:hypothetical protein
MAIPVEANAAGQLSEQAAANVDWIFGRCGLYMNRARHGFQGISIVKQREAATERLAELRLAMGRLAKKQRPMTD